MASQVLKRQIINGDKMKIYKLLAASVVLATFASVAQAKEVHLEDGAAIRFVDQHSSELSSDGGHAHNGVFHYVSKDGKKLQGYASCWIQPMGDAVFCDITY